LVGPGLATILGNFQVFLLALVGVAFYKEHLTFRLVMAIPTAMLGLFLVLGLHWQALTPDYRAGVIFGLVTALCYAGFNLCLRRLQRLPHRLSPVANLALVSLVTALFLGGVAMGEGASLAIPDIGSAGALGAYGILSQVCGWVLIAKGLPGIRASLAGLLLLLQPSLAYVWDILIFGLPVTWIKIVGTLIALFAIYLGSSGRK